MRTYAAGAAVVSTLPEFEGGLQASARDDRHDRMRLTIAPEQFRGGFAVWSGTSFAAPLFAGRVAARLGTPPEKAEPAVDAVAAARAAVEQALGEPA